MSEPLQLLTPTSQVTGCGSRPHCHQGGSAGATFTVSNVGAVGGGYGTTIVPWGTTAILSFGRAEEKPVARERRVSVAPIIPLSLSYDHRVIDGAMGRRFLALVVQNLETTPSA